MRFKRAPFGRGFVAAQPLRRCRLTAHHLLSRTLQLQIKGEKINHNPNEQEKNNQQVRELEGSYCAFVLLTASNQFSL